MDRLPAEEKIKILREALTCVGLNIVTFKDPTKCACAYFSPAEVELIHNALKVTR